MPLQQHSAAWRHSDQYIVSPNNLLVGPAGIILLFGLTAAACTAINIAGYRGLKDVSRLIFVSHIAYLLLFISSVAPYSLAMVKALFGPGAPAALLQPAVYRSIFYPVAFQLVMYVFEVRNMSAADACHTAHALRAELQPRMHHRTICLLAS